MKYLTEKETKNLSECKSSDIDKIKIYQNDRLLDFIYCFTGDTESIYDRLLIEFPNCELYVVCIN